MTLFLKLVGKTAVGLLFLVVNMILLWNYSGIIHKVKIEDGSTGPVFQVVVMESGNAHLFLQKRELDDYLRTHPAYSFLIPDGQDQLVQDQIASSYKAEFGPLGGEGYPTFKRKAIDANRQYIELYM